MDAKGDARAALLRRLAAELDTASSPAEIGSAVASCVDDLREMTDFDQVVLLLCERNRDWISVAFESPIGENTIPCRPSREVGLDVVASFVDGVEFIPAESATDASKEMAAAGVGVAWAGPLMSGGVSHGMLSVSRRSSEKFSPAGLSLLSEFSRTIGRRLGALAAPRVAVQEAARRDLVSEVCRWPDGDEEPQELFTRLTWLLQSSAPIEALVLTSESDGHRQVLATVGDDTPRAVAEAALLNAPIGGPIEFDPADGVAIVPLTRGSDTIGHLALAKFGMVPLSTTDLAFFNFFSTVLAQALVSRQREMQLRAAEQRYQHLFQEAPAMYVIIGVQSTVPLIVDCNELFLEALGYPRNEVIGRPLSQFDPSERRTRTSRLRVLANDEERTLVTRSGMTIDTLMRTTPEYGPTGKLVNVCAMYIDVSERNRLQHQIAHQAFHDGLTDLPNRVLFLDRLGHALQRNNAVSVALLDLDDFKIVNDSLGHASGDELLVLVARRLRDFLMPADTIARMGGDEFTILLEDPGSEESALARMEALAQAFEVPFRIGERDVYVDASIGLIFESSPELDGEELLRRADIAMYEAKRRGKGGVQLFEASFQDIARHRLDLENDLRNAIDSGHIVVWYQPVIDLATGDLAEMEALARWDHPQRGILPPSEFIDLAEESGLIVSLGREVLRRACLDAKRWIEEFHLLPTFRVAVNASVKQLERPKIVEEILSVLDETGLPARHLKLEVTESLMMTDGDGAVAKLERLAAAGVGIAIDDFGTGYSSLSYLKRLPVDTVKIDRSFVKGIEGEGRDTAIVQAVVAFAEGIGLTVTVEGVESLAQLNTVRGLGCDRGQGFYFSKPLPMEQLTRLFGARRLAA
ncbi:MAG: EAL domain-containing protein [bacterium]